MYNGNLKDQVKGSELTAVSHVSLYQEAKASAMKDLRVCAGKLKCQYGRLNNMPQKPEDDVQNEGED